MVPKGWEEIKLISTSAKEKYSFTGGPFGSDLKSSDYTDDGVRIIQLQNIGDGRFNNGYKIFTSEDKADELSSCNIFPGEIILSKMGDPVARATIIPPHHRRYLMASDGIRLKVDESKYDTFFIHEVINAPHFRGIALSKSTGSTRKRIGLTDLKNITFHCPPLLEQQKIAKILSTWDKAISTTELLIENSTQQKKALMQQLLTGKKRLLDESGQRFKGEWEELKLENVFKLSSGDTKPKDVENEPTEEQKVPVFGGNNIMGYSANSNSEGDVILIGRVGEYCGVTRLIQEKCWITDNALFTKEFSEDFDRLFIVYLLQNFQLSRLRNKGGQPQISQKPIYTLKLKIPLLKEQQKIATVLTNADKEIELLEQQLADLQQEKKALMQVLLTGKVRVLVDGDNLA